MLEIVNASDVSASPATILNVSSVLAPPPTSWYQAHRLPLYVSQTVVAMCGILTNTINILIFLKIGMTDAVTVSFFGLSISDLLHLVCFSVIRVLSILQYEMNLHSDTVRLQDFGGSFGWLALYFLDVSMYITVFATIQKCCCVALPFTFKSVFTTRRSAIAVAAIFIVTLAIFLPVFVTIIDKWFFDPLTKKRHLNWIRINTSPGATVWRYLERLSLTWISQTIIVVSLVVITIKLKQSVKFRLSNTNDEVVSNVQGKADETKICRKEWRAIQAVQLIAFIFILTTLPSSVNSLVTVIYPKISLHRNVVLTVQSLMYFGGTISASVNIFVYLKYNSRYKTVFLNMLTACGLKTPGQELSKTSQKEKF